MYIFWVVSFYILTFLINNTINITMTKEFLNICESIRRTVIHERGTLTRAQLVSLLSDFGYDTNIKKITRLEADYDKENSIPDFELIYYIFKALNIRFDPILFPDEHLPDITFIEKLKTEDANCLNDNFSADYRLSSFNSNFITNILPSTKPNSSNLYKLWKSIHDQTYEALLPPRISIIGDYASGKTSFINTVLCNQLSNISATSNDSKINYYISTHFKPKFIDDHCMSVNYIAEDFTLADIYDIDKISRNNSDNKITVFFIDNPLLKKFTLVESNIDTLHERAVLDDAKQFIFLCNNINIKNICNNIINILQRKEPEDSFTYINGISTRINLVFPKQDFIIKKDIAVLKRTLSQELNIDDYRYLNTINDIINHSIAYDAMNPNTFDSLAKLFNKILNYFDKTFINPYSFPSITSDELKNIIESKLPISFFENIQQEWIQFIQILSRTIINTENHKNISDFLSKEFNKNNSETLSWIDGITGTLPDSNILKITKDSLINLENNIDEKIHNYLLGTIYCDYGSSVYNNYFENNAMSVENSIKEFLKIQYKKAIENCLLDLPTTRPLLNNITGALRPRAKSIIKKLMSEDSENLTKLCIDQLEIFNKDLIANLESQRKAYIEAIEFYIANQNIEDLEKIERLIENLNQQETEYRERINKVILDT